jgi:4-amino-4-deoxy-L-arabinose transferase-like glycosyltransferase
MQANHTHRSILYMILAVALVARLGYSLTQDALTPFERAAGGDAWWYLEYGYRQIVDERMEPLSTAPLYVIIVGGVRWLLQPESIGPVLLAAPPGGGLDVVSVPGGAVPAAVIVIRVLQALLSTATVYFVYRIGRIVSGDGRVGLVAAGVMATSVAMIVSAAEIQTEPLYLFFLCAALMLYVELSSGECEYRQPGRWLAVTGGLLALATLTRAVLLLFPVGLLIHAALVAWRNRRRPVRTQVTVRGVTALLAVYMAICSIWTGYYQLRWGEFVVGAKGISAFLYLGTQGEWDGPQSTDESLGLVPDPTRYIGAPDYAAGAAEAIAQSPARYALNRVRNLAEAYAQPYGTVAFPGDSIKAAASGWLRDDRTFGGLVALLGTDGFAPKLLIYIVHYIGMGFGLAGMVLLRARWRVGLPLVGLIVYITLLHLALLALPRYIFPTLPLWWCFAAVTVVRLAVRLAVIFYGGQREYRTAGV